MSRRTRGLSLFALGLVLIGATLVVAVLLFLKPALQTDLTPGATVRAEFSENHRGKIYPDESTVKLAGLEVGKVSTVEVTSRGTALVSMKVDGDAVARLGPTPSATLTPRTVLGSIYSIELIPGGGTGAFDASSAIPVERTSLPSELDRILEALPGPTRENLQGVVAHLDETLAAPNRDALHELVRDAPATLGPAAEVVSALRGTRPDVDLPELAADLQSTVEVVTRRDGQLEAVVDDLAGTTAVLAARARPLADTLETLPATLRESRAGLADLGGALDRLTVTADRFEPAAAELAPLLDELAPALEDAKPLVADLRPLLEDAEHAVEQLGPAVGDADTVLDRVRGPVLERVNGPILDVVLHPYRGTGPFEGSGDGYQADHTFYEELGYLLSHLDRGSMNQDAQGSLLSFQVGAGAPETVTGFRQLSLEDLAEQVGRAAGGDR